MTERPLETPLDTCLDARLWGKQRGLPRPYPVVCHLLDTAAVMAVLWDRVLGDELRVRISSGLGLPLQAARPELCFWAGLHDLGKISPPFQGMVPELYERLSHDVFYRSAPGARELREFRHEMATHWSLSQLFADVGYPTDRSLRWAVSHQVAQMLGGHHGRFGELLSPRQLAASSAYRPGLGGDGWAMQRRLHFDAVRDVVGATAVPFKALTIELAVVVGGLVTMADWLASQIDWIVPRLPAADWRGDRAELEAHWERAQTEAPGRVSQARIGRAEFGARRFEEMFPFSPNGLQQDIAARLPGLVSDGDAGMLLVTAPTGDGKTEAALHAASILGRASGARGVYFALPTMATADAMYPRLAEFAQSALDGDRALTLLHSMAWLSPFYSGTTAGDSDTGGEVSADRVTATEAGTWLRGARRGLLAPLGVGTIDQALTAVLPVTYNTLRLTGLTEKVVIVDEAHAYGPWMHKLLARLLEWLAALRVPVVLLSATLTGRTATSLVDAYRRGRGVREPAGVKMHYPGWLFAPAAGGRVFLSGRTSSQRVRTVDVSVKRVAWEPDAQPDDVLRPGGRREALREVLAPVAAGEGTALVCCTTVTEAQQTFRDLRDAFPELAAEDGGVRLLHSRFPVHVRQRITAECEAAYGKPGPQQSPSVRTASILVATQVVEQSIDLDFDVVVSDLAPLAQLLQRVGRCRRHTRGAGGRPSWAQAEDRPHLVVLDPLAGGMSVPGALQAVYDPGLLVRTAHLLGSLEGSSIRVPDDVQGLVDSVYAEDFVDGLEAAAQHELRNLDTARQANEMAQDHLAEMVGVCGPIDARGDLYQLSRREAGVTEELLTSRLGADTGRVPLARRGRASA